MTDLDSPKARPTFPIPRILKDALGNARLARTRETQNAIPSPDLPEFATWETSQQSK